MHQHPVCIVSSVLSRESEVAQTTFVILLTVVGKYGVCCGARGLIQYLFCTFPINYNLAKFLRQVFDTEFSYKLNHGAVKSFNAAKFLGV